MVEQKLTKRFTVLHIRYGQSWFSPSSRWRSPSKSGIDLCAQMETKVTNWKKILLQSL